MLLQGLLASHLWATGVLSTQSRGLRMANIWSLAATTVSYGYGAGKTVGLLVGRHNPRVQTGAAGKRDRRSE